MAYNEDLDDKANMLDPKSWRELKHYQKFKTKDYDVGLIDNYSTFQEQVNELNKKINALNLSQKNIEHMSSSFLQDQLCSEDLAIIDKNNDRMCYWIWCFIKFHSESRPDSSILLRYVNRRLSRNINSFITTNFNLFLSNESIKKSPTDITSALDQIQAAFYQGEHHLEQQREILTTIVGYWTEIFEKNNFFISWLDKDNHEQIAWAWDYMHNSEYSLARSWTPTGNNDRYHALIAEIDYNWFVKCGELSDTMRRMKSAWAQKKFRDKTKGTKAYSVSMTEQTKIQLTWLVERENSTIHAIIKDLIREKYDKIKADGKK